MQINAIAVLRIAFAPLVCLIGDCFAKEITAVRQGLQVGLALAGKVQQIALDTDQVVTKALSGDLEGAKEVSEPYRAALEYGTELLQGLA